MILKMRNNLKDGWRYYEGNEIQTEYQKFGDIGAISEHTEIFLTANEVYADLDVKIIIFHNYGENENKTLITDSVCYLLNDNGKTIDRI